ncbi:CmpA/NrtA family ABC transporter substrate-binding protein [Yoonia sp. SS1-5]|uniref:CmpA/NrtA family ABC transporter substrate-binding protein n=1 Tax=Yoonia rhodophyticola TaxID=3137370 RepID=A0AAN0MFS7_9RHOB
MTRDHINCGYVPLVDSAPLIIARELRFAEDEGIRLNLLRQPSWSALRDLLALGHLDVAHMLSPMPVAMSLGLGGLAAPIDALMVLSVNGNIVGVSNALADGMRAQGWDGAFQDPRGTASALLKAADAPLRVGIPFPFSMHRLLFEYWMRADPAYTPGCYEIITTPPPLMAETMAAGELDVFCVGEPWGSMAVAGEVGELILPMCAIWEFAPEKVLGARRDWVTNNPQTCGAVMRAVYRAAKWLDRPDNHALATEILARSEHLDLPGHVIDHAIRGQIVTRLGAAPVQTPHFLRFHAGAANFPWRSQAAWIGTQLGAAAAQSTGSFRSDLFRTYLGPSGVDMPGASAKLEGAMRYPTAVASTKGHMILGPDAFFNGATFDFDTPE